MDLEDRENLSSVCTVRNPVEAEIIRNALESAGIACQIGGETQAGLTGVLEIDVLAHESEVEKAREILRELKHISKEERRHAHEEAKTHRLQREGLHEGIQEPKFTTGIQPPPELPD